MAAVAQSSIITPIDNAARQPPNFRLGHPSTVSVGSANNLWEKAIQHLDEEDKANINFDTSKLNILEDILAAAADKQRICLAKRLKYKKGDKEIIIRDKIEKIVGWVNKFKEFGDQIVQYDPGHAALPWAAVRFFLQCTVNDTQVFGAMAEGMEFVSGKITYYAIFEKLYLRTSAGSSTKVEAEARLNEALCKLYAAILQYLSKAKRYYSRSSAERFLRAAADGQSKLDQYISQITKAKTDVDDYVQLIDAAQTHTIIDEARELKALLLQLNNPINRSAVLLSDIHDSLKESERRDMFKWLSRIQSATHHKTMGKDFLPGSGNWLLQKKEFVEWRKESSSSILWLHGIPGSGKSKLIYSVIEHLNKERSNSESPAPIAYFYCVRNTSEPERADPDEIMRSILRQLSSSTSAVAVREPVAARYKELKMEADEIGEEPTKLTITECQELILELLNSNPATIIIDALDECDPARRHELLEVLDNIIQESSNVVNVFVSSRNDNDLVCRLESSPNVIINVSDNGRDIQRFIVSQVDQSIKNKRLLSGRVSDALREQIINVLTEGAQGMFRWVSLQLQNICDPQRMKHEGDIRAELGKLPKTLNDSYQLIYERIISAGELSQQIAERALKWLLCSKRRLSPSELIAAITVNPDGECIPLNERELLDSCCNLVVLDEELKTFRFAHLSVREYLERLKTFNSTETNTLVLQRCVDVCMFEQQNHSDLAVRQNKNIESYAIRYWPFHCQSLGTNPEDQIKNHVKNFLIKESDLAPSFQKWCLNTKVERYFPEDSDLGKLGACFSSPPSLLFLTCRFGLTWLMHDLNQLEKVSWNQLNRNNLSGLQLATELNNEEIVRLLLEREEVAVNCRDRDHDAPLLSAVANKHEAIVRLFLHREDVDVNLKNNFYGMTPLAVAAEKGHEAMVRLLLERDDIEINCEDPFSMKPLAFAARAGHEKIIRLLLERHDIEVNCKNRQNMTPLASAARHGHKAAVRILLERAEIEVNCKDLDGMSPLAFVAVNGHEEVMRLLLQRDDIEVNCKNSRGMTLLALAAANGHESVVRLLLERDDVEVESLDRWGRSARDVARYYGHGGIVRILDEKKKVEEGKKEEKEEEKEGEKNE